MSAVVTSIADATGYITATYDDGKVETCQKGSFRTLLKSNIVYLVFDTNPNSTGLRSDITLIFGNMAAYASAAAIKTDIDTWNAAGTVVSNAVLTSAIDGISSSLKTIEYEHHEIHSGKSFHCYFNITTAATSGHRSGLYIKTPATGPLVHLVAEYSCSVAADFSIHEAPTLTANIGTHGVAIYNRYRDSGNASGCFDNATTPAVNKVTTLTEANIAAGSWAAGTTIMKEPLAAGSGPKTAGGDDRGSQEFILKANTAYVFMLTNTVATANVHHISLDWYEHTNA